MGAINFLGMRCDDCRAYLRTNEVGDEDLARHILPGITSTGPAVFAGNFNMIMAEQAAESAGWEQDPNDYRAGRVLSRWSCCACAHRVDAMHVWIKENRMTDEPL